jgi:hypothetical protein
VTSYRRLVCSEKALRVRVIVGATRGRLSARSLPVPSSHGACDPFFPARVPARSCAPVARSCCACRATLLCARSSLLATARRARASNLFLARRDARCHACFAHPRRPLASAPTRQSLLSHPRQHATVVVFVESANTLLSIRLPSLLYALLRARRVLPVVPQHSCLPLARVNARAPARYHCVALALRLSGFARARVCR